MLQRSILLFGLLLPFEILGVRIGGYLLSAPTLLLLFTLLFLLLARYFDRLPLLMVGLFLVWCLITAVAYVPFSVYSTSIAALTLMLLPFCFAFRNDIDARQVLDYLALGVVMSFIPAIYQFGVNFGLPSLTSILRDLNFPVTGKESVYFGIYRVQSGFTEPSHYAHYLVLSFAILDTARLHGYNSTLSKIARGGAVVATVATVSLSGMLLGAVYLVVKAARAAWDWRRTLGRTLVLGRTWIRGLMVAAVCLAGVVIFGSEIAQFLSFTGQRLRQAWSAVGETMVAGSEASRMQSILIMGDYIEETGLPGVLTGEGYGNYQQWFESRFGYLQTQRGLDVPFARGDVYNMVTVILVSTGIIGVVLYAGLVWGITRSGYRRIPLGVVVTWLAYQSMTAYMTTHKLWWPLFIGAVVFSGRGNTLCGERVGDHTPA